MAVTEQDGLDYRFLFFDLYLETLGGGNAAPRAESSGERSKLNQISSARLTLADNG